MSSEALDARQARLLAALVSDAAVPPGFDAARIRAAARGLAAKRSRAVMDAWPVLANALGPRYGELFAAYGDGNVLPATGSALLDGALFCDWLIGREAFPQEATLERQCFKLRYTVSHSRVRARRGFKMLVVRHGQPRKWVFALRLPLLGEYWWQGHWWQRPE